MKTADNFIKITVDRFPGKWYQCTTDWCNTGYFYRITGDPD